jgi:ParB family chromosome partitioning protein
MAKQALGKGLGALIGGSPARTMHSDGNGSAGRAFPDDRVLEVSITEVVPSPMQPRSGFTEEHLTELVDSIREKGIIQPLIVRRVADSFELIAGERRWRAAQQLQLEKVKIIVRDASDQEVLEMALIENLQREDLNPIEEARAYARLADDFGMKQAEIASRVGKNRATVANAIRLLELGSTIQSMLERGEISVGHAKVILGLPDEDLRQAAAGQIVSEKMSVRAAERLIQALQQKKRTKRSRNLDPGLQAALQKVEEQLQTRLGTRVSVSHALKRGRIRIDYYGVEDLNRILGALGLDNGSELD